MRLAQEMGTVSELYPQGVSTLLDLPFRLAEMLDDALKVLGWQRDLDNDEMPPKSIWQNSEELSHWFDRVNARRKAKMEGKEPDDLEEEQRNPAARGLLVG